MDASYMYVRSMYPEVGFSRPESKAEKDRFLSLRISSDGDHFLIDCENSTDAQMTVSSDGVISTSKADSRNHGYGISSVRRIVEKHAGVMDISCGDGRFKATVTI